MLLDFLHLSRNKYLYFRINASNVGIPAPDLDGGGLAPKAWWETPCADTESLGR